MYFLLFDIYSKRMSSTESQHSIRVTEFGHVSQCTQPTTILFFRDPNRRVGSNDRGENQNQLLHTPTLSPSLTAARSLGLCRKYNKSTNW